MNKEREAHISKCREIFESFPHKYLLRHVNNGKPLGTIIVYYSDGLKIGFSKVHKTDRYNRYIGIAKAIADSMGEVDRNVPHCLRDPMTRMVNFAQSERGREILC